MVGSPELALANNPITMGLEGRFNDDFPFINLVKKAVSQQSSGGYAFPAILDENGYPSSSPATEILQVAPLDLNYVGSYVLKWEGTCPVRLQVGGAITPRFVVLSGGEYVNGAVTTSLTTQGSDGRIEFTLANAVDLVSIYFPAGATYTNPANLALMRSDQEADYDGGEIFNPDWVERLTQLGAGVLRFMDWGQTNQNNTSRLDQLHTPEAFSWGARRWSPGYWAGTASGTDAYTCGPAPNTPAVWTDGEAIQLQFTNANTGASSLDINGRGAKNIMPYTGSGTISAGTIPANALRTLVYDEALDALLLTASSGTGFFVYVPLEVMVAACNKLQSSMWFNIPPWWGISSVTDAVEYIRDNLDPSLDLFLEYANEIWNFAGGFEATSWADNRGIEIGFPSGGNRRFGGFYALQVRLMMAAAATAWSPRSASQFHPILAFQAKGPEISTSTYRIGGADLTLDIDGHYTTVPGDIVTNYSVAPNRPVDFVEFLSYATYYSGKEAEAFDARYTSAAEMVGLMAAADDYATGDPLLMEAALDWLDGDLRDPDGPNTITTFDAVYYPQWAGVAVSYGKDVMLYEGGLEIQAPSASRCTFLGISTTYATTIQNLFEAYRMDHRCHVLVTEQMDQFMASDNAERPVWFVSFGPGQWSGYGQSLYTPYAERYRSWDALVDWNHN